MLENLLGKKYLRKIIAGGAITFIGLFAISVAVYEGSCILGIYNAFETAIGAFGGSHGTTLELLIAKMDNGMLYMFLLIAYIVLSLLALAFSAFMVTDLLRMLYVKSKEGSGNFDEDSYVIFGYNPDVITMIENSEKIRRKDIHIVSLRDFTDEEIKEIDRLSVSYDCIDIDKLNRKKFYKVKYALMADTENMNNYSVYKQLIDSSVLKHKDLRISCMPVSEAEQLAIENDRGMLINMIGLKQIVAHTVAHSVSEILCKKINSYRTKNLKCLLIGFGETGQNVFKVLVNQLCVCSGNTITVDIVDKDGANEEAFENIYRAYRDENGLCIKGKTADGILDVNVYNCSYNDFRVHEMLINNEYDFVVLNFVSDYKYADFIEQNRQLIYSLNNTRFIVPALVNSRHISDMCYAWDKKNKKVKLDNLTVSEVYESFTLELLKINKVEEYAQAFNFRYNEILGYAKGDEHSMWRNSKPFDRKSSIHQSLHQDINVALMNLNLKECREGCNKLIELMKEHSESFDAEVEKTINGNVALKELAMTEHRRWTYFEILEGFRYWEKTDKDLKRHECIANWNTLCKNNKDTLIYDMTPTILAIRGEYE